MSWSFTEKTVVIQFEDAVGPDDGPGEGLDEEAAVLDMRDSDCGSVVVVSEPELRLSAMNVLAEATPDIDVDLTSFTVDVRAAPNSMELARCFRNYSSRDDSSCVSRSDMLFASSKAMSEEFWCEDVSAALGHLLVMTSVAPQSALLTSDTPVSATSISTLSPTAAEAEAAKTESTGVISPIANSPDNMSKRALFLDMQKANQHIAIAAALSPTREEQQEERRNVEEEEEEGEISHAQTPAPEKAEAVSLECALPMSEATDGSKLTVQEREMMPELEEQEEEEEEQQQQKPGSASSSRSSSSSSGGAISNGTDEKVCDTYLDLCSGSTGSGEATATTTTTTTPGAGTVDESKSEGKSECKSKSESAGKIESESESSIQSSSTKSKRAQFIRMQVSVCVSHYT